VPPLAASAYEAPAGNIGINIGVAAPMAYFPFSGWKDSFLRRYAWPGPRLRRVLHRQKVVVERLGQRPLSQILRRSAVVPCVWASKSVERMGLNSPQSKNLYHIPANGKEPRFSVVHPQRRARKWNSHKRIFVAPGQMDCAIFCPSSARHCHAVPGVSPPSKTFRLSPLRAA